MKNEWNERRRCGGRNIGLLFLGHVPERREYLEPLP